QCIQSLHQRFSSGFTRERIFKIDPRLLQRCDQFNRGLWRDSTDCGRDQRDSPNGLHLIIRPNINSTTGAWIGKPLCHKTKTTIPCSSPPVAVPMSLMENCNIRREIDHTQEAEFHTYDSYQPSHPLDSQPDAMSPEEALWTLIRSVHMKVIAHFELYDWNNVQIRYSDQYPITKKRLKQETIPPKEVRLDGVDHRPVLERGESKMRCKNANCSGHTFWKCAEYDGLFQYESMFQLLPYDSLSRWWRSLNCKMSVPCSYCCQSHGSMNLLQMFFELMFQFKFEFDLQIEFQFQDMTGTQVLITKSSSRPTERPASKRHRSVWPSMKSTEWLENLLRYWACSWNAGIGRFLTHAQCEVRQLSSIRHASISIKPYNAHVQGNSSCPLPLIVTRPPQVLAENGADQI
ncbi:unnamed protein product, partial [Nesidiocoris tenuis]